MSYTKPGVEITQVQKTQTPVLTASELEAVIVGNGYWVQDISWESDSDTLRNSVSDLTFTDNAGDMTLALSGINSTYYDVEGSEELVAVDLIGVSGPNAGALSHLVYGEDYSVASNTITISGTTETAASTYQIRVGFRAKNSDVEGYKIYNSSSDIESFMGTVTSWNPLAYGLSIAQTNSASRVLGLGVEPVASPDTEAIDAINNTLSLKNEVYAIAPVTHNITATALKTHCVTYSAAENKKERIAFYNGAITYPADPETLTSTQRDTLAGTIRDANSAIASKRVFSTHPDIGFVLETRHISTVKPSFINASFDYFTTIDFSTYGPFCRFVTDTKINGIIYKAGTEITETLWTTLKNAGWGGSTGYVTVNAPVPGFYYNAMAAGQVAGKTPSQPLTNAAASGIDVSYGSTDMFSESELNKMAQGGTFIYYQNSESVPLKVRHQVSTDITSVAKRELSITTAVDYTAKFIRNSLEPYIGLYNITEGYIGLVGVIITNIGARLVADGIIKGLAVNSIVQDAINPDTLNIEVTVEVLYPANYIKIQLVI